MTSSAGFTGAPKAVTFTPDNLKVVAADGGANQVLVFDLMLGTLEQGFADAGHPLLHLTEQIIEAFRASG